MMTSVGQDLRYALRQLRRSPGFTAVAVVSLALGIGANAAIFSLFEQALLRSVPVQEPARLVNLSSPGPKSGSLTTGQAGHQESVFSYPMFRDMEAAQESFTGIAAHRFFGANLATGEQTVPGGGVFVSGSYFPVLGVRPALGRLLGPQDDEVVGGQPVAVLSHRFWEVRMGSDPGVLNRTIVVNGRPLTIVGVAPAGFDGVTVGARPDVFVPITMRGEVTSVSPGFDQRRAYWAYLFARLRPGVSVEQAAESLNRVYRPIIEEVEAPLQIGMTEQTLAQFREKRIVLEDGRRGQSTFHADVRTPLLLLMGITGIVLLITCANLANLLLARGARRGQELAIRASLGGTRNRLLTQLMTEACVLAIMGGAAALLVAQWTLYFIGGFLPANAAAFVDLQLQPAAVAWTAALALGTGLLFGIYPAAHATRPGLAGVLRSSAGQPSGGRSAMRFRTSLVTAQIALSMALLVSAGLFVRSLLEVSRVEVGISPDNLVAFDINPGLNGYAAEAARALFDRVEEELAAVPGATSVSAARIAVLRNDNWDTHVSVEGFEWEPGTDAAASYNNVGPAYFRTLGIPLLAGREFTTADGGTAPRVAIVNEAFARKFGLEARSVVGTRMAFGLGQGELDMEIIGLVRDANYSQVKEEAPPMFFTPWRQHEAGGLTFYVRTATDPRPLLATIPTTIRRLDAHLPVQNLTTVRRQLNENVFLDRMISALTAAFAGLATLLAAVGLFGVMAYTVAQRTREIGLRMALGAESGQIRRMVLGQVGRMVLVGGAIGIVVALALGRAAGSLLYGVEGHDPVVVAAGVLLLALVAMGAGYLPARRAASVDPMIALRAE
jgi:predicted permease